MSTLDVADCCETLEEARGVIRRMEREIFLLREESKAIKQEIDDCNHHIAVLEGER